MKIKHIEAQVEVCCKSGRNYRMPLSDFEEIKEELATTVELPEPDWSSCLPEGWELRTGQYGDHLWRVFTDQGTHNGGYPTPLEAIGGTMRTYREMWLRELIQ